MATLVHLVAVPYDVRTATGARHQPTLTKSPPYFGPLDVELLDLGQHRLRVCGDDVGTRWQVIDSTVLSVAATVTGVDPLDPTARTERSRFAAGLRDAVLDATGYAGSFVEEYLIVTIDDAGPDPDAYVDAHLADLAALVRSEARAFTPAEAATVLVSRTRYADDDLTVVDWEGAIVFDPDGDTASELALCELGNSQVLRYRMLDRAVEDSLEQVRREMADHRRFGLGSNTLRAAIEARLQLLLDFERTEQRLLLIGDWYTAQLYAVIVDELYIDDWKAAVRAKLDDLQAVTDSVRANFSLTWQKLLDLVELFGWLALLVGYFVLFFLEVH